MEKLSSDEIKELLLDMALKVTSVLDENEISYVVFYGSLLGAIRHEGFIPWDDDFDIVVAARDLPKLREIDFSSFGLDYFDSKTNNKYYDWVVRVADKTTLVKVSDDAKQANRDDFYNNSIGVSIDIYPAYFIPKSDFFKKFIILSHKLMSKIRFQAKLHKLRLIISICDFINYALGKVSGDSFLIPADFSLHYSYDTLYLTAMYDFESIKIKGPGDARDVLSKRYGNWHVIPSEVERQSWIHYEEVIRK